MGLEKRTRGAVHRFPIRANAGILAASGHHVRRDDSSLRRGGSLLEKRAISEVLDESPGFVRSFFCIKKRQAGQFRPIVNMDLSHFKMENLESVRFLVGKVDWLAKIDLEDAYFTVSVDQAHQWFLRFRWAGRVYFYS